MKAAERQPFYFKAIKSKFKIINIYVSYELQSESM